MGILSSIKKGIGSVAKAVTNVVKAAPKAAAKTLDYVSAPLAKPVTTLTKGISAGAKEVEAQRKSGLSTSQGLKQIAVITGTTAVTGAAVLAAAPAASTGAAGAAVRSGLVSVGKALVPTTTRGKLIAGAVALPVAGAFVRQPAAFTSAIAKTPSSLANVGGNIADFAVNPSLETGKAFITENPVIVGAAAAVGAVVLGKTLFPAIATARQTEAIQEQTTAIKEATGNLPTFSTGVTTPSYASPVALTPATQEVKPLGTTTTKKKRRSRTKAKPSSVNQRVSIVFDNDKIDNKRYLKGASVKRR